MISFPGRRASSSHLQPWTVCYGELLALPSDLTHNGWSCYVLYIGSKVHGNLPSILHALCSCSFESIAATVACKPHVSSPGN